MKSRDPISQYCWDWVRWCETRHFYIRSSSGSTLGALQKGTGGGREPNARNDPDMQYFNMAVHTLRDQSQYADEWLAFEYFYLKQAQLVKTTAHELGVGVRTYYDMVNRFARRAWKLAPSLKKAHEELQPVPARLSQSSTGDVD